MVADLPQQGWVGPGLGRLQAERTGSGAGLGHLTLCLWGSPWGWSSPQAWLSPERERWHPGALSSRVRDGGEVSKVKNGHFLHQNFSSC